jgi:hypothetical protein
MIYPFDKRGYLQTTTRLLFTDLPNEVINETHS